MIPLKHFYMIRHGETEANAAQLMAGSLDSPLTEKGRAQAYAVHNVIQNLPIKPKAIIHSHLSRARDTALIINEMLDVPVHEEPDIAEMHAGEWEGQPWESCRPIFHHWEDPPGGETVEEFFTRIRRGKKNILSKHDGPALIVSHGGVFRAFGKLYDRDPPSRFKNCHLYEFEPNPVSSDFPWIVSHYEYTNQLIRQSAELYHAIESMADQTSKA